MTPFDDRRPNRSETAPFKFGSTWDASDPGMMMRVARLALAVCLAFAPVIAAAQPAADLLPLPRILEIVASRYAGEVIDVDVRGEDDDEFVYAVRLLTGNGNILLIEIDAEDGAFLGVDGRGFLEALKP